MICDFVIGIITKNLLTYNHRSSMVRGSCFVINVSLELFVLDLDPICITVLSAFFLVLCNSYFTLS